MAKKLLQLNFWKNYTMNFYAGMASGISLIIWQELTKNIQSYIYRTILLVTLLIITYFLIGLFGQFAYNGFKKSKIIRRY